MTVSKAAGRVDEIKRRILELLQKPAPRGRKYWTTGMICRRLPYSPPIIGHALSQLEREGAILRGFFRTVSLTERGRKLARESGHAD
jgi:Mn-dependent DtxR family transcriptional regulator